MTSIWQELGNPSSIEIVSGFFMIIAKTQFFAKFQPLTHFLRNMNSKPNVVFVLGGPGAGKGTQCERIVSKYGFKHLSAGDLLREEREKPSSQYGELIETHIRNGTIVPVAITCALIERAMRGAGTNKFLIDGFPRNQDNLDGWNKEMADKTNLLFVLVFDCPINVCVERCLRRGAKGSGRSDDNADSLQKRVDTFNKETASIIAYYESKGNVKRVNADRPKEEVYNDVDELFNGLKY